VERRFTIDCSLLSAEACVDLVRPVGTRAIADVQNPTPIDGAYARTALRV
jgi:hypothetical protein